jgi:hypothetical protein
LRCAALELELFFALLGEARLVFGSLAFLIFFLEDFAFKVGGRIASIECSLSWSSAF